MAKEINVPDIFPVTVSTHKSFVEEDTINMSSIEDTEFLINLRNEAKEARPGILPKDTRFDSYIRHTVINLSDTPLNQHQIKALEKGLTFCQLPAPLTNHRYG